MRKLCQILVIGLALLLTGCNMALLDPKGVIAAHEKNLLIDATFLMLLVVIPVIILSLIFAWKYRARNKSSEAEYSPDWGHSTVVEVVMWSIPCFIIAILAVMAWISSHKLDPYKPLASKDKTLVIEVVALDWRWLFIYPKQHIATLSYVQIPVNTPVRFLITADAPMNSFIIPRLAGQIYAMPGMRSKLNMIATKSGSYAGRSVNFSGAGFSKMTFVAKVTTSKQFDRWVEKTQHASKKLSMTVYNRLIKPSEDNRPYVFSSPAAHLFQRVIDKYRKPSRIHISKNKNKSSQVTS